MIDTSFSVLQGGSAERSSVPLESGSHQAIQQVAQTAIFEACRVTLPGLCFHVTADGDRYFGSVVGGKKEGYGICLYSNGDVCIGRFVKDRICGWARYFDTKRGLYTGYAVNDLRQGRGLYFSLDGDRYEGNYENGITHGFGVWTFKDGNRYEGNYVEGKKHGAVTWIANNGDRCEGVFYKGKLASFDTTKEAGSIAFLEGLLGTNAYGVRQDYALHIISDFLSFNGNQASAAALRSALEIYVHCNDTQEMAKRIYSDLKIGKSQLLACSTSDHAVGVQLIPRIQGYVDFEIYNSGYGLRKHHPRHSMNRKFQTRMIVRIPENSLTEEVIHFLLRNEAQTMDQFYEKLLTLENAVIVKNNQEIWQRSQKGKNCTIEWIFAYLKHALSPLEYNTMRLELFHFCLKANILKYHKHGDDERVQAIRKELTRKREKRVQKHLNFLIGKEGLEDRKGRKDDKPDSVASHHSSNAAR